MTLLHATWLPSVRTETDGGLPAILLWADTWRTASTCNTDLRPAIHPFTLQPKELRSCLEKINLMPNDVIEATTYLTLPSKKIKCTQKASLQWTNLPL